MGLYKFILFLILCKKDYSKPKNKKYLIYDSARAEEIVSALSLKKNSYSIYYNRYNSDTKLNIFIIFQMIKSFKFKVENYKYFFFKYIDPEFVITLNDNNEAFFFLKKLSSKIKTICIQCSWKHGGQNDIYYKKNFFLKKKINLNCDYYLSYNKEISKEFSKFIKARFIEIGSFNSNNEKKTYDKSIDFLYISQFKKNSDDEIFSGKTTFFDWRYNEIILLRNLSTVFKIRKIRLTVIGRCVSDSDSCDEEKFFRRFFPDLIFIRNIRNRKTYKFVDKAQVVIGIDSTLAYESFIRGNKTIFFSVRNYKKKNLDICRFCWPKKLKLKGSFWTNTYSFKEINRLLDLYYLNTSLWNKIYKQHVHNFGKYDFKNRSFLKLIKSLHNYKKFSALKKN